MDEAWTPLVVVQRTAVWLRGRGVKSARLDAELLLAYCLKVDRLRLYLEFDKPLTAGELAAFKALVRERAEGKSVAHLLGGKEFWKRWFQVPVGVFVPRPETELLVEEGLRAGQRIAAVRGTEEEARDRVRAPTPSASLGAGSREGYRTASAPERPHAPLRVLDLCTGSGAVAVSLAGELPDARVVAVDVSQVAVQAARRNAEAAGVADRVEVVCADAGGFLARACDSFDLITCNPPYVPSAEWPELPREITRFEPREAVDGGGDGLDFMRGVAGPLVQALRADGVALVEYSGREQTPALRELLAAAGLADLAVLKDLAGLDRVMRGRRGR